ncbi:uridine phosphorylase 1-like [Galleria mellonella]|uniref:Uridine phosphorylase 1-like n=1 Tax=Galleria mellonella TaxID=7137 RepID=A0A6J1WNV9_GALME|nr:uridine phosphorylase 1-like [Galleria mellonella]
MAACDCDNILPQGSVEEQHYDNCRSVWAQRHPTNLPLLKNEDGTIGLKNRNILNLDEDVLYHLAFTNKSIDLEAKFGDVKFVCTGGTKERLKEFALYMAQRLGIKIEGDLRDWAEKSKRFAMYKVGPILAFNHGIGIPSMTIALQEVIKMLFYAKAKNPIFFRIGTCGGLGVEAGSVVISKWGLNGYLNKSYDLPVLGKTYSMPSFLDRRVAQELYLVAKESKNDFQTYLGGTMGSEDFYRGQARLDGPFCNHTKEEKMTFLKELASRGVKNIEMEATAFAALMTEAGIRGAIVCVPFLNRLHGDQVTSTKEQLTQWENNPMKVVGDYIVKYYENQNQ